jgi:hypothetical protein
MQLSEVKSRGYSRRHDIVLMQIFPVLAPVKQECKETKNFFAEKGQKHPCHVPCPFFAVEFLAMSRYFVVCVLRY